MEIDVANVFVDNNGQFGNPVGIIVDEKNRINEKKRQNLATKLNFSETVFINSLAFPNVSIFNPQNKVKFAGHAVLGTIYFINHVLGKNINSVKCDSEMVTVKIESNITYICAPITIIPSWNYKQLASGKDVEELPETVANQMEHTFIWAWIDESKGLVRARTFVPDWGIPEDQANGSGSIKLASQLNKNLVITHGLGSVIYAKPLGSEFADVGGLVKIAEKITL